MLFLMCTGNGSAGMCEPVTQERKQNMYNTKSINESYIFRSIRKAAEICSGHFRTISAIFRKVSTTSPAGGLG